MSIAPAFLRRPLVLAAGSLLCLAGTAGPALAADPGSTYGDELSFLQSLLYFVVTPLVLLGIITLLSLAPGVMRRPRYRPAKGWTRGAVWFGAPSGSSAIQSAKLPP